MSEGKIFEINKNQAEGQYIFGKKRTQHFWSRCQFTRNQYPFKLSMVAYHGAEAVVFEGNQDGRTVTPVSSLLFFHPEMSNIGGIAIFILNKKSYKHRFITHVPSKPFPELDILFRIPEVCAVERAVKVFPDGTHILGLNLTLNIYMPSDPRMSIIPGHHYCIPIHKVGSYFSTDDITGGFENE